MGFKKLLRAFGVGGPSVETVLATPRCRPGDYLSGEVQITGGDHDVDIEQVVLGLITRVETEHGDHDGGYEASGSWEFHRNAISGPCSLGAGQNHTIPFRLSVPLEAPITEVFGQHLRGMMMGVRTELEVAGAIDKGDLDPISIAPLPAQQRVLDAFTALGFRFKSADLEQGHKSGFDQRLPFYQEIEFFAPPRYSGRISEVELTFVTTARGLAVILEADGRDAIFAEGGEGFGRFQVTHEQALQMPWEPELDRWLQAVAVRLQSDGHGHGMSYGHQEPYGYGQEQVHVHEEHIHSHEHTHGYQESHDDHGYAYGDSYATEVFEEE